MGELIIADTPVAINAKGMYSLNDMHKAAMAAGYATESQRPANFLKSQCEFVAVVDATGVASVKSIKGGKNQGTWAIELVAMKYAGWISPVYEVQVYQIAQSIKAGEIAKAVNLSGSQAAKSALDEMRRAKTIDLHLSNIERFQRMFPRLGDKANQAFAAAVLNPSLGIDAIPLPAIEEKFYTTTEIAEEMETTAAMLGRIANQHNLKTKNHGEFRLSQSQHGSKQVEQWYWNETGRQAAKYTMEMLRA